MNLLIDDIDLQVLCKILDRFSLHLECVDASAELPGSYWGAPEAGLIGHTLYVRPDTPLHSALHEACHYICMDQTRRASLDTDAGGDTMEENGVCFLQILLADQIPGMGRERMFRDMDEWGYSFRLGSAQAWFEQDADDALQWLMTQGLIDEQQQPTWRYRL
jgi:hypothetical protein